MFLRTEIQKEDPIMTNVEVNGMSLKMEVDTGAAISIGGEEALKNQLGKLVLEPTQILLRMYNGTVEKPLGVANVEVLKDSGELVRLPMVVTPRNGPVLFGRNRLREVQLDWNEKKLSLLGG